MTLGLLIDTSGSQRRVLPAEERASYKFLEKVLREGKDNAFIIHFDREAELLQGLTSSRAKLEKALSGLEVDAVRGRGPHPGGGPRGGMRRGRGGTVLYDSLLLASEEVMLLQSDRKALVMLSDGVDNGSRESIRSAIEAAQRADTLVYSVLFADPQGYGVGPGMGGRRGGRRGPMPPVQRERPDGKKVLRRLAEETGGGFFEVSKRHPIDKIFAQIDEELRHQYSLGYSPQQSAAGFRAIRLTAKRKDLIVQARNGYFAK